MVFSPLCRADDDTQPKSGSNSVLRYKRSVASLTTSADMNRDNSEMPTEVPPTFGQLIAFLFPPRDPNETTKSPVRGMSKDMLHRYMKRNWKTSRWLLDGRTQNIIQRQAFSRRLLNLVRDDAPYSECADLAHILIEFYQSRITLSKREATRKLGEDYKWLVEFCFLSKLPEEVLQSPFTFLILESDLLRFVADPEKPELRESEQALLAVCYNGVTDIYRSALTIFRHNHLPLLSARSPEPVVQLALLMARVCVTYGEYDYARQISVAVRDGFGKDLDRAQLMSCLAADRVHASAKSHLYFKKRRSEIYTEHHYATGRIDDVRKWADLSKLEVAHCRRALLTVTIRALVRARLLAAPYKVDESDFCPMIYDEVLLNDLEEQITYIEGLDLDDDPTYASRFVHWDTLARGYAMLIPKETGIDKARTIVRKLKKAQFLEDVRDRELLLMHTEGETIGLYRFYRRACTLVYILFRLAEQASNTNHRKKAILRADSAISAVIEKLGEENMFHMRIELELLRAKILQLGGSM